MPQQLTHQRLQVIGFFILLAIAAVVVFMMWLPFFKFVALGGILAILFLPIYRWFLKRTKRGWLAAFVTLVLILLIVIVPLYAMGQVLFNELTDLYGKFRAGEISISKTIIIEHLPMEVRVAAENALGDLSNRVSDLTANLGRVTDIVSKGAEFFLGFFLVAFTVYYLLRDGDKLRDYMGTVFPLSAEHGSELLEKLESAINGVVKGSFLVALTQGAVATIGFFIFGVPQPFLWGSFTVLAALVPTVGTSLALVPAVIYLFITGHIGAGIGMMIWGAVAVGTIDNIISPRLIGSRTKLHPLLVLFSVIGGLQLFGFIGFLLGPIIMAVFVTLLDIYRVDLKGYLEPESRNPNNP